MKTAIEFETPLLPSAVRTRAETIVIDALNSITTQGSEFIVNDELFFREVSPGKITPCVVNGAAFISSRFQAYLDKLPNCAGETKLSGQAIDGLLSIPYKGTAFTIKSKRSLSEVVFAYIEENQLHENDARSIFPMFLAMYGGDPRFPINGLPASTHDLFDRHEVNRNFKVGVEFETGNIASSFRALRKLSDLFASEAIDSGIFVTSIDKANSATRIWPVSNRNGSFEELKRRNYESGVDLPLLCIGFAPDGFSSEGQHLGQDGNLYKIRPTSRQTEDGMYRICEMPSGSQVLKRI